MLFKSKHPDIHRTNMPLYLWSTPYATHVQCANVFLLGGIAPTHNTVWQWLFESPETSPLYRFPPDQLAGYTNAVTKERVNWAQVKECATYVSTALVRKYGLQEGQTVSLFTQNTIWYPVAMYATIRVGMFDCNELLREFILRRRARLYGCRRFASV